MRWINKKEFLSILMVIPICAYLVLWAKEPVIAALLAGGWCIWAYLKH